MLRLALLSLVLATPAAAQFGLGGNTSGAPLHPEAAAYDVQHYALDLQVVPDSQTIAGTLTMEAVAVAPTAHVRLDLDDRLDVYGVYLQGAPCPDWLDCMEARVPLVWQRPPGQVRIALGRTAQPGDTLRLAVRYGGAPRVAPRPPWDGGLSWERSASGEPWVAVSCQGEGSDLWWPVKDHPSDEPDRGVTLRITAPEALRAVANGRFVQRTTNGDGTASETYRVTTPINNYGVSFGVGPFVEVRETYRSPLGYSMPATFYVLPEREADARRQMPGFLDAMGFMERTFGPYGSREDGYHVLHTPYLGMEHQSLIAYGSTFEDNAYGFDWLHFHELAHEWFANLGTAPDWRDFWIHESFATYAEALYAEDLAMRRTGNRAVAREAYLDYLAETRRRIVGAVPLAPEGPRTTTEMYNLPGGGFNADVYFKGAWVLHTLRYALDDDRAFFRALGRLLYPETGPTPEAATRDPSAAYRWVSTADVQAAFQRETDLDLSALFHVYLRQPALPVLRQEYLGNEGTAMRWELPEGALPDGMAFELPVPINAGRVVPMPGGEGLMPLYRDAARPDTTLALFEVAEVELRD